jgi:hypothetical protein
MRPLNRRLPWGNKAGPPCLPAAGMDRVCPEDRSGGLFPRQRKPSVEPAGFAEAAAQEGGADRRAVQRGNLYVVVERSGFV